MSTKLTDQAEDGTRVTSEGESFYPPSGNGIAAAAAGILPKAGAVTSGDTTTEASDSVQPGGIKTPASFGGATGPAGTPAPSSPVAATDAALSPAPAAAEVESGIEVDGAAAVKSTGNEETGLETGVAKLDMQEPPAVVTQPGKPEGEVVFDHPPTEAEIKEAEVLTKA